MKNDITKVSEKLIQYKQNEIEAILSKDEARKCASELMLIASEIFDFTGDSEISNIIYNTESLLHIKY